MQRKITVGCDPEIFLIEDRPGGLPVSPIGLVPGNKHQPFPVQGGGVQVDGMALEININPAETRREFIDNIRSVMGELTGMLPPMSRLDSGNPFMEFDPEFLAMQPDEAKELGCEPDYNAYTGKPNPRPNGTVNFRTAAGHIHIGWDANVQGNPYDDRAHYEECMRMARQMDYYVGVYSLMWDGDDRRRNLYGKAGAFRAKSYGIEYRTPSTAWLADERLQAWVYDATVQGVEAYFRGERAYDMFGEEARSIIDNNEVDWLNRIDFGLGLSLPYELQQARRA